jgi:hypothetical protein
MEQIDGDVIEHSDTHLVFKGIGTDLVMTYKLAEPIKKPLPPQPRICRLICEDGKVVRLEAFYLG